MENFSIPVVLFFFRRKDKTTQIVDRIAQVKPKKIYLISDGPRNEKEEIEVNECRKAVEEHITWNCEIIKNYAESNKGVYDRIGLGAKWVFEKEDKAIFLEDDNLPELTFFRYCEELLNIYQKDNRILWICGTNYLEKYNPIDNASYVFTKHLLPCGWASWSDKYINYYDGELKLLESEGAIKKLRSQYSNKALFKQQLYSIKRTKYLLLNKKNKASWDHQMSFSLRINDQYGISPKVNQIKNIGVDEYSEHGGTSFDNVMTQRFCGMDSLSLEFPLKHPKTVYSDPIYEKKIGKIILFPLRTRIMRNVAKLVKPLLRIPEFESFSEWLSERGLTK